jgi:hypothetical protein
VLSPGDFGGQSLTVEFVPAEVAFAPQLGDAAGTHRMLARTAEVRSPSTRSATFLRLRSPRVTNQLGKSMLNMAALVRPIVGATAIWTRHFSSVNQANSRRMFFLSLVK